MRLPLPRSAVFESAMTPLRVSRRPTSAPNATGRPGPVIAVRPPGRRRPAGRDIPRPMITQGATVGHVNSRPRADTQACAVAAAPSAVSPRDSRDPAETDLVAVRVSIDRLPHPVRVGLTLGGLDPSIGDLRRGRPPRSDAMTLRSSGPHRRQGPSRLPRSRSATPLVGNPPGPTPTGPHRRQVPSRLPRSRSATPLAGHPPAPPPTAPPPRQVPPRLPRSRSATPLVGNPPGPTPTGPHRRQVPSAVTVE